MIPHEIQKDFKTLLNMFKRIGRGVYSNEKESMQRIYSNTELLFANNVKQNPIFIKILSLLIFEYVCKYGDGKNAIQMIIHNSTTGVDLLYFKLAEMLNVNEWESIELALNKGEINEEQKKAMILNASNKWNKEHIEKSVIKLANELIFNERANEL